MIEGSTTYLAGCVDPALAWHLNNLHVPISAQLQREVGGSIAWCCGGTLDK